MNYAQDILLRLRNSRAWIGAQFWAALVLFVIGMAWTRIPDRHVWQVLFSLLLPVLLIAAFLLLQAGTMRSLFNRSEARAGLATAILMLAVWCAVVWGLWCLLNWCDDRIDTWAGYLNSRASATARAKLFTYEHIFLWFTIAEWVLRWIVIPGKVIPHAVASAQYGWRMPWRNLIRLMLNWRWWTAMIAAALAGVLLPTHFFSAIPHGAVVHQIWAVIFKLAGTYLLVTVCWVLLLAWAAVLLSAEEQRSGNRL